MISPKATHMNLTQDTHLRTNAEDAARSSAPFPTNTLLSKAAGLAMAC